MDIIRAQFVEIIQDLKSDKLSDCFQLIFEQ